MFNFRERKFCKSNKQSSDTNDNAPKQHQFISKNIDKNLQYIKEQIGVNSDLNFRQIPLSTTNHNMGYIVYLKSCVDKDSLDNNLLKPLTQPIEKLDFEGVLKNLPLSQVEQTSDIDKSIEEIFKGTVLFLIENKTSGFLISIINKQKRPIEESKSERTVHGSREGFIEHIDTNIFLVRHKLPDPKLISEEKVLGVRTKTRIAILYIKDIADDSIVTEVKNRVDKIETDSITATGMIEQFIEDSPGSIFPQIQYTERPERVVQSLLEGRICILCDGTPFALMMPSVFAHFLSATEDYYERTLVGSLNRLLRYIAVFVTITLPSIYIALTSYHPELIPFNLIIPLAEARKEIPFPPLVEAFLLELTVEFIREMGVRLPQPLGNSLGVIGGIVLGDAAIRANMVSPAMVIVVGATAVISFTIPNFSMLLSLRYLRFFMMLMAGFFGAFGITISWIFIFGHLIRLESFSIPYLSPFAPVRQSDIKDTFFRTFLWKMKYRPKFMHTQDVKRQSNNKKRGSKDE